MQAVNNQEQSDYDPEASNDFSSTSYFPEFVHRQDTKRHNEHPPMVPFAAKIEKLTHELVTTLQITTPTRLRSFQLRKQLKNYNFEKFEKKNESERLSMFGVREQDILRDQNILLLTLTSLMREFRSSKDHRFYLITKKSERVYTFYHEQIQEGIDSILTISGYNDIISPELTKEGIPFEKNSQSEMQKILIKNQSILILWGRMINKILQSDKNYKSFNIVANFPFANGYQSLPVETFNGREFKKQFHPISIPQMGILGEPIYQVYRMKIQGCWTTQNLKQLDISLTQMFGQNKFQVEMQLHKCTQLQK